METDFHRKYKKMLDGKHACYVLITCDKPDKQGKMNVHFSYEGEEALASYLIEGAKQHFEEDEEIPLFQ